MKKYTFITILLSVLKYIAQLLKLSTVLSRVA